MIYLFSVFNKTITGKTFDDVKEAVPTLINELIQMGKNARDEIKLFKNDKLLLEVKNKERGILQCAKYFAVRKLLSGEYIFYISQNYEDKPTVSDFITMKSIDAQYVEVYSFRTKKIIKEWRKGVN